MTSVCTASKAKGATMTTTAMLGRGSDLSWKVSVLDLSGAREPDPERAEIFLSAGPFSRSTSQPINPHVQHRAGQLFQRRALFGCRLDPVSKPGCRICGQQKRH